MDYDIIIYAVIAVLVLARLWSVLGQRNPEDRERPNPFAVPPVAPAKKDTNPAQAGMPLLPKPTYAPASLAGGLAQIKEADPAFDERKFLQGVRVAFTMILADFAKGDLSGTAKLLASPVLDRFHEAVEARRNAGQTLEHKLLAIREAECVSAKVENNQAFITVRFVSQQESITRDNGGQAVSNGAEELTDFWTFARDLRSPEPDWILIETKS